MRDKTISPLRKTLLNVAVCAALAAVLGGCTSLQQAMGIQKVSPDEFAIVTKAPLVIPPDYNLRPPAPGTERNVVAQPQELAQNALFGRDATPVSDGIVTAGEFAILTGTRAEDANPNIRSILTSDGTAVIQKNRRFTNQILFWQQTAGGYDSTVVNAAAESDRIRDNQATGRPVTSGQTPTITKNRGLF